MFVIKGRISLTESKEPLRDGKLGEESEVLRWYGLLTTVILPIKECNKHNLESAIEPPPLPLPLSTCPEHVTLNKPTHLRRTCFIYYQDIKLYASRL